MHTFSEPLSYAAGFCATISTFVASIETEMIGSTTGGWLPLVVQAGMAGIVVLLVMKHIPAMQKSNAEAQDRFLSMLEKQAIAHNEAMEKERIMFKEVIERVTREAKEQNEAWRDMIAARGHCIAVTEDYKRRPAGA